MKTTIMSLYKKATMILIMAVCLVSFNMRLFAQEPGMRNATPEERGKRQTELMKEKLNLTAAQEPKVDAINMKYARKMEDSRKTTDTAARRKTFELLNKQKDAELKGVFTPDQFKAYQKLMEELKARRQQRQHR